MAVTPAIRIFGYGTYGYGTYGNHAAGTVIAPPSIVVRKIDNNGLTRADLSCDVRAITINRGRSTALDSFAAGSASILLANKSDKYSAWTPNSIWSTAGVYGEGITLGPYRTGAPVQVSITRQGATYNLFTGTTDSVEDTWPDITDAVAVVHCTDDFKKFARYNNAVAIDPVVGAGESSALRIQRLAQGAGYPSGKIVLNSGTQAVQGTDMVGNTLSLMDATREAEYGYLFMDGAGKLQFWGRDAITANPRMATVQWTLSDKEGVGGAYSDLHLVADDDQVYNTATITRTGGLPQTTTYGPSVTWFGLRSYPGGNDLPLLTDVQASNLADLIVSLSSDNDRRIESVTFHANKQNPYLLDMACGVQLLDRIRLVRMFPGGHQLDVNLLVQGISHNIAANVDGVGIGDWTVTLSTTTVIDYQGAAMWDDAIWDESTWGE